MGLIPNLMPQNGNAECASLQGGGSHQDSMGGRQFIVRNPTYGAIELWVVFLKMFLMKDGSGCPHGPSTIRNPVGIG